MNKSPYELILKIMFEYGWTLHRNKADMEKLRLISDNDKTRVLYDMALLGYEARANTHWFRRTLHDIFIV
jgi:hypothetical protein